MSIYSRGKAPHGQRRYQFNVMRDGVRHKKNVICSNMVEAEGLYADWFRRIQREMITGEPINSVVTVGELLDGYLEHSKRVKKSWRDDEWRLAKLKDFLGADKRADRVTLADVEKYQDARSKETVCVHRKGKNGAPPKITPSTKPISPATVNREVSLLSVAFNHASRSGLLRPPHNPCVFCRPLPEASVISREPSLEDFLELCAGRSEHVRRALLIARFTGMRAAAVAALDWSQLRGSVFYPTAEQAASSKRMGRVPVPEWLWPAFGVAALHKRPTVGPVLTFRDKPIQKIKTSIVRARRDSGIYFRLHDLRACYASDLRRAGVSHHVIKLILGHGRDLAFAQTVSERYQRIDDEDLVKEVAKLPDCTDVVLLVLSMKQKTQ